LFVHLVLVPYVAAAGELKSKPAQHSVKEMRSIVLFPDIIICRADREVEPSILEKISLFCNVPKQNVFQSIDMDLIYKVPKSFHDQGVDKRITDLLGMWTADPKMDEINKVIYNAENPVKEVNIGIIGKYTELIESYKSLDEALRHAAIANQVKLNRIYIDAEDLEKGVKTDLLEKVDGILVPGGFGPRGTEGKIKAIQFAREKKKPFLGICLGLQLSVIEFARNVAGIKDATSMEFTNSGSHVVHYMSGQKDAAKGGSMRLGAYECDFQTGSLGEKVYNSKKITERHRHRLEVNNEYINNLIEKGLVISGKNTALNLVEVIELKDHPYFIACQYHPEFKSRPFKPHPLFATFVKASGNK
jgi:CTP synthase